MSESPEMLLLPSKSSLKHKIDQTHDLDVQEGRDVPISDGVPFEKPGGISWPSQPLPKETSKLEQCNAFKSTVVVDPSFELHEPPSTSISLSKRSRDFETSSVVLSPSSSRPKSLLPLILCRLSEQSAPMLSNGRKTSPSSGTKEESPSPSNAKSSTSDEAKCLSSTLNLLEALAIDPVELDELEQSSAQDVLRRIVCEESSEASLDIDKLIQETEEAFKNVGLAFAETYPNRASDHYHDTAIIHKSTTRSLLRKQQRAPIIRSASISRSKRKRPERLRVNDTKPTTSTRSTPTSSPRRTLTDGVFDLFSGKLFHRTASGATTKVEPMSLSPVWSKSQLGLESPSEKLEMGATQNYSIPIDSTYLQDSLSKIENFKEDHDQHSPRNHPMSSPPIPQRSKQRPADMSPTLMTKNSDESGSAHLQFHDMVFPHPPRASTSPQTRNFPQTNPVLPAIPESSPLSPVKPRSQLSIDASSIGESNLKKYSTKLFGPKRRPREKTLRSRLTKADVILESTPFSLTYPGFRHGRIRLMSPPRNIQGFSDTRTAVDTLFELPRVAKNDNNVTFDRSGSRKKFDERLDWTVLQKAVAGGADDLLVSEDLDLGWQTTEMIQEAEDVFEWWTGFGMELGELHRERPHTVGEARPDTETRHGQSNLKDERDLVENNDVGSVDAIVLEPKSPLPLLPINPNINSGYGVGRQQHDLPSNPMEVGTVEEGGKKCSATLMEHNLINDLENFLRWEIECISGKVWID